MLPPSLIKRPVSLLVARRGVNAISITVWSKKKLGAGQSKSSLEMRRPSFFIIAALGHYRLFFAHVVRPGLVWTDCTRARIYSETGIPHLIRLVWRGRFQRRTSGCPLVKLAGRSRASSGMMQRDCGPRLQIAATQEHPSSFGQPKLGVLPIDHASLVAAIQHLVAAAANDASTPASLPWNDDEAVTGDQSPHPCCEVGTGPSSCLRPLRYACPHISRRRRRVASPPCPPPDSTGRFIIVDRRVR